MVAGELANSRADSIFWTNSAGGLFSVRSNWSPNLLPGLTDTVQFTNANMYFLTVDVNATNSSALFHDGVVTQSISASAWLLTNDWRLGETVGRTARVTSVSGSLTVTNAAGAGVISVGRAGTGELALGGGDITTDHLESMNGGRSILTLAFGNLTTLQGVTVSNGTLVVGTSSDGPLVWNFKGGSNQIMNDGFAGYGGLTLGTSSGAGRAVVNLTGSNTVLTVPGLDAYGRNSLFITGGAKFHTKSVQWGLQGNGNNNVVVISDPGSSWINESLMYFGMHAGSQTLIITNGGYFQTGVYGLHSLENPGNRFIVTGSNSWFYINGVADFGQVWCTPICQLDNLVLITNGANFWVNQLAYGSLSLGPSSPGTVVDVADGNLWIGSLTFTVGTLRLEAGTGTIDQFTMNGGTNAVLQTVGDLLVGHHGTLNPGELQLGSASAIIPALNGELRLGGWRLGAFAGDSANVTMVGGRAFVTNASQTASLVVGAEGNGTLRVDNGFIQADRVQVSESPGSSGLLILNGSKTYLSTRDLTVGTGGAVIVTNAATLQINSCVAPVSAVSVRGATLEFASAMPALSVNSIITSNAIIGFRGVDSALVDFNDSQYLGRIHRDGQTTLQLIQTTNASLSSLVFRGNDPSNWAKLVLGGGLCGIQAGTILVENNSSLAATNTVATVDGSFTNRGQLILHKSTLRFVGPVTLSEGSSIQGFQGVILFDGGVNLPSTDLVVPAGVVVRASSFTSGSGKLVLNGGGVIPNLDGSIPPGMVVIQDGWVTYLDTPAAPLTPPTGLTVLGSLGLELIRSTNAGFLSSTFPTGAGGYSRLRLGTGSGWQSDRLVIGENGSMSIADPSASVTLTSEVFRVENGGLFRDDTGGPSYIGFSSTSANAVASVSGTGSAWATTNAIAIGTTGSQNQLLVELGGTLLSNSGTIGGSGGNINLVTLTGPGSSWFATNGVSVLGTQNRLLIQTGAAFFGSQLIVNGASGLVSVAGPGASAACSGQAALLGSQSLLQVSDGGNLMSRDGVLNAPFGSLAEISGAASLWQLTGILSISPSSFSLRTNQVSIKEQAVIATPSLSLIGSTSGRAALAVQSGRLYVTNSAGTGAMSVNAAFNLYQGLLHADRLTSTNAVSSSINIRAGIAEWTSCDLSSGIPLRIGNGTNMARLNLLGGTNTCRSGLDIRRHALLTGSGIIVGTVTNHGIMRPGAIGIRSDVVLDATSELLFSIGGPPGSPANASLVVTGNVALAGSLGLSLVGFTPSSGQTFVLLQYGSLSSNFSNVAFGQRMFTTDRLASFQIADTGTAIIAAGFRSEDLDGDGIQDNWALQHFGISPLLPGVGTNDLNGDLDGDGLSNRDEFLLQTDPNDASSCLRISVGRTAGGIIEIHFPYSASHSYRINTSDDLATWRQTPIEEFQFDTQGLAVWSDTTNAAASTRFYKLSVE